MHADKDRAAVRIAVQAAATNQHLSISYRTCPVKSTAIDEILARLIFALASPSLRLTERTTVLTVLDNLIRRKIDAGPLKGVSRGA